MGIAQTKIPYSDAFGNDEEAYIRLSTEDPTKDVALSWKKSGSLPLSKRETEKLARFRSETLVVAQKIRERIARKKENDSAFRPCEITDEFLVKALNTLSLWEEKSLVWTLKNGERIS